MNSTMEKFPKSRQYIGSDISRKNGWFHVGASANPYMITKVPLPKETIGACRNSKRCKQYDVTLGNGLCINCWDTRTGGRRYEELNENRFLTIEKNEYEHFLLDDNFRINNRN